MTPRFVRRFASSMAVVPVCLAFGLLMERSAEAQALVYRPSTSLPQTAANQVLNRPTVSPYLQLAFRGPAANNGFGSFIATYQGIVRPQIEAREEREAALLQLRQLQQQVAQIRNEFQLQQQRPGQFTTGHVSRYRVHSHFYPRLDQLRQQ